MTWWQAVVLGLVEGITEYLPVSSTGHLILVGWLLGLDQDPVRKAAVDAFDIVVQGGAILAVLGLYAQRVQQMLAGVVGRDANGRRLFLNVALAFLPAAVLGPVLDDLIEAYLFSAPPVLLALAVGGAWMIWLDRRARTEPRVSLDEISPRQALTIGCLQCVAMWPGTSRSMMTIAGGTLVGLRPQQAAEFSFLVGLPTLGAACAYKLLKNLLHSHETGDPNLFQLLGVGSVVLGIVVATASAAVAVRGLVAFLGRYGLAPFGWYRIGLAAFLVLLIAAFGLRIGA